MTITAPEATWIDADVEIGADATIEPGSYLRGETRIAGGAIIGPHATLTDSTVGAGATVLRSHLVDCDVEANCNVGPFTYLRPAATLREGAKAGAFVEVKNSEMGRARRCPTSHTSATPTLAPAQTSAPARSRPTTTDSANTGLGSATVCGSPLTRCSSRPLASVTMHTLAPVQ